MPKKNKVTVKGKPRNKFEQSGYDQLDKSKIPFDYEWNKLPYTLNKWYTPDFTLYLGKEGKRKRFVEFKGYFDAAAQTKMKAVKKTNPDIDIRFVFQDASKKIRKGAKLTYGEWATKWGFPYAEKSIPTSWLK